MAKTNLGRVSLVPSGEYDSSANYKKLDVVSNDGSMYICKKDCIGVPTDNEEYWLKAVQKGDTGEQGPMPVNGVDYNTTEEKETLKNEVVENATKEVEENIEKIEEEAINNFNTNATTKTNAFDTNAAQKTTDFNTNATDKTSDFDTNAEEKTIAFNENYEEKMLTFEELQKKVKELESENELLKNQIPTGEVEGKYIHLTDSSNMNCDISIVGNSKQATREGYNKLDINSLSSLTKNGVTWTVNGDGSITVSGTCVNYESNVTLKEGTLDEGEYTYKCFGLPDTCKTNIWSVGDVTGESIRRFTAQNGVAHNIVVVVPIGETVNFTIKPMLVKGSYTNDTLPPFEQYGISPSLEYPSEVGSVGSNVEIEIVNKNLFKIPYPNKITKNMLTLTVVDDVIKISGTATTHTNLTKSFKLPKICLGKTVTLSATGLQENSGIYNIGFKDSENSNNLFVIDTNKTYKTTLITEEIYNKVCNFDIFVMSGATIDVELKIQLEIDSTPTDFKQHQSQSPIIPLPQELCKIGDYTDTIKRISGRWKIVKRMKNFILNGTESVIISNEDSEFISYGIEVNSGNFISSVGLCNYLNLPSSNSKFIFNFAGTSLYIKVPVGTFENVDDLKIWLTEKYAEGKPLIAYGVLETPEYIDLPDETQKILNNIKTYKNISNILVDGIGTLKVVYRKDLETLYKNQETRLLALENVAINQ